MRKAPDSARAHGGRLRRGAALRREGHAGVEARDRTLVACSPSVCVYHIYIVLLVLLQFCGSHKEKDFVESSKNCTTIVLQRKSLGYRQPVQVLKNILQEQQTRLCKERTKIPSGLTPSSRALHSSRAARWGGDAVRSVCVHVSTRVQPSTYGTIISKANN